MLFSAIMTLSSLWALYYLHYGVVPETHQQGLLTAAAEATAITASVSPTLTPLRISGPRLTYSVYPTHVPTAVAFAKATTTTAKAKARTNEALEKEKLAFRQLSENLKNWMCYYYHMDTFNTIIASLPFSLTLLYICALCLNSCNRDKEIVIKQRERQRR